MCAHLMRLINVIATISVLCSVCMGANVSSATPPQVCVIEYIRVCLNIASGYLSLSPVVLKPWKT